MDQPSFDFWKFLAGIGIFLYGMGQLETALKSLAGKSFREMLQRFTDKPWKGILVGALITAVLQSSSLVTLMVLAFLGAKILNLRSSIGVILGANLGTTITAWIVATLGFKLSVADFSLPFLGLGSLAVIFFSQRPFLKNIGYFCIGFGLLFLGLDFMKTAIEEVATQIDFKQYQTYGLWIFLLIGIVVTALIQSSSAMMVIILSGIHADVVTLTQAATMVVGANIGTTITVALGALHGVADKKRLALAHFLFNVITGLIIFLFIEELIEFTMRIFLIDEPLIELVLFNTVINFIGILLFFPFLGLLEKWLMKRFISDVPEGNTEYIKNVSTQIPQVAISAVEKEVSATFQKTVSFIFEAFGIMELHVPKTGTWKKLMAEEKDPMVQYKRIKSIEDELTSYHIALQEEHLSEEEAMQLTSLMLGLRLMVYSAKDIKDILHNLQEMEESDEKIILDLLFRLREYVKNSISIMQEYVKNDDASTEPIPNWGEQNNQFYKETISGLYDELKSNKPLDISMSTLTNVNRQTISGLDNLGHAIIHWKHRKDMVIEEELNFGH
ncbi:Na/Pi cotransporter family protein [Pararhodonellum marinum]|uniref:Na/Pi cotransporter family protein n=1 Tax=Pararhodonellum marinum TaxID=2755358 RepID=UPI00188F2F57|nr:Na/Pi symporter [Pararhodonellum marinum]